jgi:hypothetical protein
MRNVPRRVRAYVDAIATADVAKALSLLDDAEHGCLFASSLVGARTLEVCVTPPAYSAVRSSLDTSYCVRRYETA